MKWALKMPLGEQPPGNTQHSGLHESEPGLVNFSPALHLHVSGSSHHCCCFAHVELHSLFSSANPSISQCPDEFALLQENIPCFFSPFLSLFLVFFFFLNPFRDFPGGSVVKNHSANAGDAGSIPGLGRSPGEGNDTHYSILVWEISWIEEPGRLQSVGSQRVEHDLVTKQQTAAMAFRA